MIRKARFLLCLCVFFLLAGCRHEIDEAHAEGDGSGTNQQAALDEDDNSKTEGKENEEENVSSEEKELIITEKSPFLNISACGACVTLRCEAEIEGGTVTYQWYEGWESALAIENAHESTFKTESFLERESRYYYCEVNALLADGAALSAQEFFVVAYTALPLVQIDTVNGATPSPAKEKVNGRLQIFYPDGKIYDSGTENGFTIKVRGNATSGYPKRPYKLKLPKKKNLLAPDSSENKDKNWVLLAGYCDKTLLRTKTGFFSSSLFNGITENEALYVPRSCFVDVVLNGEYLGNYCLTDSVKEGAGRLAVNENAADDGGTGFVAEYDPTYYAREPKWFKSELKQFPYTFKFPDTDDAAFDDYMAYFESYINDFEKALYDDSADDWKRYIDMESFARWFLAHNMIANIDTNYFFSKATSDGSSTLVMGPVWDFEWSIGIGWYYDERPRSADYWCVNGWYFAELLKKEEFVQEVKSQWEKLKSFYPDIAGIINAKMDEYAYEIAVSQEMNFMKWDILDKKIAVGGIPLGSYEAELACDKQFMQERIEWLDKAISELQSE